MISQCKSKEGTIKISTYKPLGVNSVQVARLQQKRLFAFIMYTYSTEVITLPVFGKVSSFAHSNINSVHTCARFICLFAGCKYGFAASAVDPHCFDYYFRISTISPCSLFIVHQKEVDCESQTNSSAKRNLSCMKLKLVKFTIFRILKLHIKIWNCITQVELNNKTNKIFRQISDRLNNDVVNIRNIIFINCSINNAKAYDAIKESMEDKNTMNIER
ncbi:hypothetical protein X798_06663 [Onchocerca flexuosa]|uniref:Uncharacterized protein n=1 Tax=Onchocerca flexuosa TaxID=387005 RepID=A0A238BMB4_9BILA|nr:hypothetical protein X798_06663 [Onchocerca flexuosa]